MGQGPDPAKNVRSPVTRTDPRGEARGADAWAQLWFAVQRHPWSTLVIVPAVAGGDSLGAARSLATAGKLYREGGVELIDASRAQPTAIAGLIAAAAQAVAAGAQVVIAVDSPLTNPGAIAVARSADAALLAVPLGGSKFADARRAVDRVGRERFIGSVAIKGGAG